MGTAAPARRERAGAVWYLACMVSRFSRRALIGTALLLAGCAAPGALPTAAAKTGTVTGIVLHATTREPLPDVAIVVQSVAPRIEAESDSRGAYLLLNVPLGQQTLVPVKDGWKVVQDRATVVDVRPDQNVGAPTLLMAPL